MTAVPERVDCDDLDADPRLDLPDRHEVSAVPGGSSRFEHLLGGRDVRRIVRYTATSVIALGVSEVCLVVVDAETSLGVVLSSVIANLAGVVPSYLLSRYWIWSEADRNRPGRQMLLYWLTSLVSLAVSSLAMGAVSHEDHARHILRLLVLGVFYLLISVALWVAKYVAYHTVIFRKGGDAIEPDPA